DRKVWELYGNQLEPVLPQQRLLLLDAVENTKTLESSNHILVQLLEGRIKKNSVIIAIGGGVIQDVAAFVASITLRGLEWIFYPTTLLAQADSCIGGKNSIN